MYSPLKWRDDVLTARRILHMAIWQKMAECFIAPISTIWRRGEMNGYQALAGDSRIVIWREKERDETHISACQYHTK